MTGFEAAFEVILENPLASLFGGLGLLCQLTWPLFRSRNGILGAQFGIGANYCLQYLMLGAWSGVGVCGIGATQTVVAYFAGDHPLVHKLAYIFLPIVAVICFLTWSGPSSLFACSACALVMIGRMQNDTLRMRLFILSAAPFGIAYDLSVDAVVALIGACISCGLAISSVIGEVHKRYPLWRPADLLTRRSVA